MMEGVILENSKQRSWGIDCLNFLFWRTKGIVDAASQVLAAKLKGKDVAEGVSACVW